LRKIRALFEIPAAAVLSCGAVMRILRGLGSRALGCGCLVGVYETYAAKTVWLIDAPGPSCADKAHRLHAVVAPLQIDPKSDRTDLLGMRKAGPVD
jgi:hypothetical protein